MPWNGSAPSQTFGRTDGVRTGDDVFAQEVAAPVDIEATLLDVHATDLKDGINACLKKDGGNTATANIPMGGFTHTNIAAATARTMPARFSQLQDNLGQYVATVGGTADAITLTPSPVITAYAAGQRFSFIAGGTNTGATTVDVSGVGAKSVVRPPATALSAGDIVQSARVDIEYDGTNFQLATIDTRVGADLLAIESLSTTGLARRTGAGTWATDGGVTHLAATTANRLLGTDGSGAPGVATITSPLAYSSSALSVGAASDSATGVIEIAVQSEMETGTSTALAVPPGRQHFHPGHPKFWVRTNGGATPAIATSHNMTSVTDDGQGLLTGTIATDFSTANWCGQLSIGFTDVDAYGFQFITSAVATGTFQVRCSDASDNSAEDPDQWHISGLGDLA